MLSLFSGYLPIIILAALVVAGIILLRRKGAAGHIGRALILISTGAVLSFAAFYAIILTLFLSKRGDLYAVMLMIAGALIFLCVAGLLWGFIKKKRFYIPIASIALVCLVISVGFLSYDAYIESIPTVGENERLLFDYVPYGEESLVATLDGEADLVLEGRLPVLDGATAMYPVYSAFARAVYPENEVVNGYYNPYTNEAVYCSTTTGAYRNIVMGNADIIFVGGPSAEQKAYADENGVELVYTPIGKEAFVFFVNSKNPIENITVSQIQDIYSGETLDWSELGVDGMGKIRAFQRDEGSGSQTALRVLMGERELMTPPREDVIDGMGGIITKTSDYRNYKNALGYSFRFYSTSMVKNDKIKLLSLNGISPTAENIENGTYPMASYFYAVTRADADENTKRFVEWMTGPEGQELVAKTGYTPLGE